MDVLNVIQSVGFPIACCVFLGYFIKTQNTQYREDVKEMTEKHENAVKEITEKYENAVREFSKSLDSNTQVLTRIEAKLGPEINSD